MKRAWAFTAALVLGISAIAASGAVAEGLKPAPEVLGRIEYPIPENAADRRYLGLPDKGLFRLPGIDAEVLIVEIFSMYCPYCQAEAPNVNKLYSLIQGNPALKKRIKIVGIGARNTPYEVGVFRKKYRVPFPLISDEKFITQKCSKKPIRTPTFIVLKKRGKSGLTVVDVNVGEIKSVDEFLKRISAD